MITRIVALFLCISITTYAGTTKKREKKDIHQNDSDEVVLNTIGFLSTFDSLLANFYIQKKAVTDRYDKEFDSNYIPQYSDSVVRERLNSLESPIPLVFNNYVKAFIDVFAVKKRKNSMEILGLKDYYFPMFEAELDKNGLPLELKYLSIIESALNPQAVSRVGATGLWQFMYSTGRLYKLNVTSYIDERKDPKKSTVAAVNYLKDLYQIYGDWLYVIAAYNCGPGNVNKAVRRSGYKKDFWDIYPYLPRETRGYVPAFIAANYVFEYYKKYNLKPTEFSIPKAMDTIIIKKGIHFKTLSKALNVPVEELEFLNPQFKKGYIPNSSNGEVLHLDLAKCLGFCSNEKLLYALEDSLFNKDENENSIAASDKSDSKEKVEHNNSSSGLSVLYYTVKPGDNLGYIADWYDCYVSNVRRWNGLRGNTIRVGQKLKIYVPASKRDLYADINKQSFPEKINGQTSSVSVSASTKTTDDYIYYTVQRGDTLWDIARKFDGVSAEEIKRANNIYNTRSLKPGQKIKINLKG